MLAVQAKLEVRPYLSVRRVSSHFVACRCAPSHVIVVVVAVFSSSFLCLCRRRLVSVLDLVLVLVWPRSSRLIWRHATRTLRHLFFWTTRWSGHGGAFAARRFRNGACIFLFVDDASSSSSFGRPPRACHHHPPHVSSLFPSAFPCAPHPPPTARLARASPPARTIYIRRRGAWWFCRSLRYGYGCGCGCGCGCGRGRGFGWCLVVGGWGLWPLLRCCASSLISRGRRDGVLSTRGDARGPRPHRVPRGRPGRPSSSWQAERAGGYDDCVVVSSKIAALSNGRTVDRLLSQHILASRRNDASRLDRRPSFRRRPSDQRRVCPILPYPPGQAERAATRGPNGAVDHGDSRPPKGRVAVNELRRSLMQVATAFGSFALKSNGGVGGGG